MKVKTISLQKQQVPQNIDKFKYVATNMIKIVNKFASEYRKLSVIDFEILKQEVAQHGFLDPVTLSANNTLIDGHNRYYVAVELGIEIPAITLKNIKTTEQEHAALSLNLVRRQLKNTERRAYLVKMFPGILTKAKIATIKKGKKGIDQGINYAIAKDLGINTKQLAKDEAIIRKAQQYALSRGELIPTTEDLKAAANPKNSALQAMRNDYNKGISAKKMKETSKILNHLAATILRKGKFQMSIENVVTIQPAVQNLLININKRIATEK